MRCGALFAGIGGFCAGFESVGVSTSWAVELDGHASRTYAHNFPATRLLTRDVRDVTVLGDKLEPVDVLHAGFPCQSFSQAGVRMGFEDPRGRLFFEVIRLLKEFGSDKPPVLLLENAPFLRYGEGGAWFMELQNAIRRAGYWFREENSAELSAFELTSLPQQRTRLYMVAFSTDHFRSGRFKFPHAKSQAAKRLEDYVDFSSEMSRDYYLPEDNRYYKMIMSSVNEERRVYQLRKYLVRVKEPNVCPTLTANMGEGGHNVPFVYTSYGLRKLTERECLALQGFPGSFSFPDDVPRAHRYKQVGNAVSVPVAELIASQIVAKFEEREDGKSEDRIRVSA